MKKKLLFFGCIIIFQLMFSQEIINQFDAQGNRHGWWMKNYDNGNIRYKGEFLHGKEIGIFLFYSQDNPNSPDFSKEFIKNTNQVKVKYFYPNGKSKSVGQMIEKDRVGLWTYFFNDGTTKLSEETYKNGILEGDYKIFYSNGKITEWSLFKNGLLHSTSKRYTEEGILIEEINYSAGKLHGEAKYYNNSGELILKGTYLNDVSIGAWEAYEKGKLMNTTYPNKKQ